MTARAAPPAAGRSPTGAPSFALLAQLWLREPDAALASAAAPALGVAPGEPAELAAAFSDLLLLNVYPYGTVFTGFAAELNGPGAPAMARLYAEHGYAPPELHAVAAPDHLGLALGLLGHLRARGAEAAFAQAGALVLPWAPLVCLAVRREPGAHPFYLALAEHTRAALFATGLAGGPRFGPEAGHVPGDVPDDVPLAQGEAEVRLRDVVAFFLAPARSGMFLSRGRLGHLARTLGLRLPFGARHEVAAALFTAAGESQRLLPLLGALQAEVAAWAEAYRAWASAYPGWAASAAAWLERTTAALGQLDLMRQQAEQPID